jgi:hypothetical protein
MDTSVTFTDNDGTQYTVKHPTVETMINGVWLKEPMTMTGFLRTCVPLPYDTQPDAMTTEQLHHRATEIVILLPLWKYRFDCEDDVEYYQYLLAQQAEIQAILDQRFPDLMNELD